MHQQEISARGAFDVVVLISGRGSNLESLYSKARNYRILEVVSDKPDAPGLKFAEKNGIKTRAFARSSFASTAQQKEEIFAYVKSLNPKLVCLAGFMLLVPAQFTKDFSGRIVNIHPSLLPGYPGLDTHKRVLSAGESVHGCSVHFVDAGVDTGPLIASAALEIEADDDEARLAGRVLKLEHDLYPWVVNSIAAGDISLGASGVTFSKSAVADSTQRRFRIFSE